MFGSQHGWLKKHMLVPLALATQEQQSLAAIQPTAPGNEGERWEAVASRVSRRFLEGRPSDEFCEAGLVLRFSDGLSPLDQPWAPTGGERPELSDRLSAAVVNARLPFYFRGGDDTGRAGLVVSSTVATQAAACAYPIDAATQHRRCAGELFEPTGSSAECVPGCVGQLVAGNSTSGTWSRWCAEDEEPSMADIEPVGGGPVAPRTDPSTEIDSCWMETTCAWRPRHLARVLRVHEARNALPTATCCAGACPAWNEMVFDAAVWEANLPRTVEAIIFPADSPASVEADARRMRATFVAAYPAAAQDVPLLRMNVSDALRPFAVVDPAGSEVSTESALLHRTAPPHARGGQFDGGAA